MPTVTAEVDMEIAVWCGRCGAGLCIQSSGNGAGITVDPCEQCLETERAEGYEAGNEDGYRQAEEDLVE